MLIAPNRVPELIERKKERECLKQPAFPCLPVLFPKILCISLTCQVFKSCFGKEITFQYRFSPVWKHT